MIQHVALEVREGDTDAEVAFWALLDFSEIEPPGTLRSRSRWVQRRGSQVHLMFSDDPVVPPAGHCAVMAGTHFDEMTAALAGAGFEVDEREQHWGARRAFTRSPTGHRVELMEMPPTQTVAPATPTIQM